MKRIVTGLLVLLAACKILPDPKSASIQYYAVDPGDARKADRPYAARLTMHPFTSPARYGNQVVVRPTAYEIRYREENRWVEPPPELAFSAVEKMIRTSGLFKPGENDPEWTLEGRVLAFDEVQEGGATSAECTLQFELFRRRGAEKIWAQTFSARVPIAEAKLPESMSRALHDIGEQMIAALQEARLK